MIFFRLCRAIALAAKDVTLTVNDKPYSIKDAVTEAQNYVESDSKYGSLDGFLALTDGIVYAIKIAPKSSSKNIIEVSVHTCMYACML